ncbi:MAG: bifunctional phosphopantothenoylcysteine decarboxylase/phosphopantothenate--cysteine ligase CoaBC [Bacteroidota bacterium]
MLAGKKILLGVCGGIAAYKTAELTRLFIKSGAAVKVVMTPDAEEFITPLTLSTLSKNPVFSSLVDDEKFWHNHVKLGEWADLFVIAPTTANTLSKMADGAANNILLTTYLSAKCPVYIAPAMDLDMYKHQSTKNNLAKLESFGNKIIPVGKGELASGLVGEGRMAEPADILGFIETDLYNQAPLAHKKIVITAGPTYEAIDPVRFIGNHSSGKMGFELAKEALNLGAQVTLITGPTNLELSHSALNLIRINSADQMLAESKKVFEQAAVFIASAAVSDYKPAVVAKEKIKKNDDKLVLQLEKNPDILYQMGQAKKTDQILVGFALETQNEVVNAQKKLKKKNLDFVVLNSLKDKGAGFGTDTNQVTFVFEQYLKKYPLKSKSQVASDILNEVIVLMTDFEHDNK